MLGIIILTIIITAVSIAVSVESIHNYFFFYGRKTKNVLSFDYYILKTKLNFIQSTSQLEPLTTGHVMLLNWVIQIILNS